MIKVETPTHIAGVMDFANGAIGTIITSFDVWAANLPRIEIYGTEGSLSVPDPNTFGGAGQGAPRRRRGVERDPAHAQRRDRAAASASPTWPTPWRSGRPHRASGELAYHVLDVMHAFDDASRTGKHINIQSTCQRAGRLSARWLCALGELDQIT